jgi:hypothetical protein
MYALSHSVECLWADTYVVVGGSKQKGSIEVSSDGGQRMDVIPTEQTETRNNFSLLHISILDTVHVQIILNRPQSHSLENQRPN